MRQFLALAICIPCGLAATALANSEVPKLLPDTPVIVLGSVTSPPNTLLGEMKMQVAIGPSRTDYTLHFNGAAILGVNGRRMDEFGLAGGQWVRAEGTVMRDARRIRVNRMQVVAADAGELRRSPFFRSGLDCGYIASVAGSRQTFPTPLVPAEVSPMVLVGSVLTYPDDQSTTGEFAVLAAGNSWTLTLPLEVQSSNLKGRRPPKDTDSPKQWIRALGWRSADFRMQVDQIQFLDKGELKEVGTSYRNSVGMGYAEALPLEHLDRQMISGTVLDLNLRKLRLVIRKGADSYLIRLPSAEIRIRGKLTVAEELKMGDEVEVVVYRFR